MNVLSQHHPDNNLLTEFVTGSMDDAQAIAISAHLHYCPRCRGQVAAYNAIGGALLSEGIAPEKSPALETEKHEYKNEIVSPLSFEQLMSAIEKTERQSNTEEPAPIQDTTTINNDLPKVVRKMLGDQQPHWKRIARGLKSANLVSGQNKYGIYLKKINAGCRVPEHNHRGSEITIVLKGSISDENGVYHQGDFIIQQAGDVHHPRASSNEDCLCLSIEEAPIKLTGMFSRLLNPFLRVNAV